MDHVVYLDYKSKELENLLNNSKTMIIRGATGRKVPYGRVFEGDKLYFVENNGEGLIRAVAEVKEVINSDKLTAEESVEMVDKYQSKLNLTSDQKKRWGGKRYLVFIEISNIKEVDPFAIDKSNYSNMDDWLPVEDIDLVRL